jgi:hypothetical protein
MVPKPQSYPLSTMASSSMNVASSLYAGAISERLTKANLVMWKAQVMAVLHGVRLVGHIMGATRPPSQENDKTESGKLEPNPTYEEWFASDQQILGFLLFFMKPLASYLPLYQRRSCLRLQPKTPLRMHGRKLKGCSHHI